MEYQVKKKKPLQGLKKKSQLNYTKDIGGSQMIEFNMIDTKATIEIDNFGPTAQLILNDGESKISITFTQDNLEYLRQKLSPQGLIPDDFQMKIVMLNQLIEELEDIQDVQQPEYELSKVWYEGGDVDRIYFDCKEVI
jgi:hypothetical protein